MKVVDPMFKANASTLRQGRALVGMLNAFMVSKGLITPETSRNFCKSTVEQGQFSKYTYSAGETLFKANPYKLFI